MSWITSCTVCQCGYEAGSEEQANEKDRLCPSCRQEQTVLWRDTQRDLRNLADEQRETIRQLNVKVELQQQEIARLRQTLISVKDQIDDIVIVL